MNEQENGSDIEKLKVMLPYLLKHNKEHTEDIKKWLNKTEQAGREEVADELRKIIELSERMNGSLEAAIEKLSE